MIGALRTPRRRISTVRSRIREHSGAAGRSRPDGPGERTPDRMAPRRPVRSGPLPSRGCLDGPRKAPSRSASGSRRAWRRIVPHNQQTPVRVDGAVAGLSALRWVFLPTGTAPWPRTRQPCRTPSAIPRNDVDHGLRTGAGPGPPAWSTSEAGVPPQAPSGPRRTDRGHSSASSRGLRPANGGTEVRVGQTCDALPVCVSDKATDQPRPGAVRSGPPRPIAKRPRSRGPMRDPRPPRCLGSGK